MAIFQNDPTVMSILSERRRLSKVLELVIFGDGKWIKRWDMLVLSCLFALVFYLPFQIGVTGGLDLVESDYCLAMCMLVNAVLILDTFLYFFRPYCGSDGNRVISLPKIRRNYLTGMFFPYLVSVFPYEVLTYLSGKDIYDKYEESATLTTGTAAATTESDVAEFSTFYIIILSLRVASLIRLVRLKDIIANSQAFTDFNMKKNSQVIELWKYIIMLVVASHWFACIWCFIALLENKSFLFNKNPNWIGHFIAENIDVQGIPDPNGHTFKNALHRYVIALFWAIQTITSIGYGNISPITPIEWGVGCFLQLLAGIAWAYVIGGLVGVAAGFKAQDELYRQRSDDANDLILAFHLSNDTHRVDSIIRKQDVDDANDLDQAIHLSNDTDRADAIIGKQDVARRIRKYIHKQYKQSTNTTYAHTLSERFPVFDTLSPDLQNMASILLLSQDLNKIPYLSSNFLTTDQHAQVAMQCLHLDFVAGEVVNLGHGAGGHVNTTRRVGGHLNISGGAAGGLGRGIFIIKKGCASAINRNCFKVILPGEAVGMEKVLLEDGHPANDRNLLKFLTFSQVLFIPRAAILEALEKNDRVAWKDSARWIYVRTIIRHLATDAATRMLPRVIST